jgi:hypothetical protein
MWYCYNSYYPFQNRRRVIVNEITRERRQLLRSGFHQHVATTGGHNYTLKKNIQIGSTTGF